MRAMKEELRQVRDIVAGKPFMLRRKFTDSKYAQLGRLYGAEDPYLDLAASVADAVVHFRSQEDHEMEELFWSQFHSPERPLPLTDRLAEWAELNRLSGLAMKDVWLICGRTGPSRRVILAWCSSSLMRCHISRR